MGEGSLRRLTIQAYVGATVTLAVVLLGLISFVAVKQGIFLRSTVETWLAAAAVAITFAVLHRHPFQLRWREHRLTLTLDEAGVLVGLLLVPAQLFLVAVLVATVVMQLWGGPKETMKRAFNIAQYGVAATITAGTFESLVLLHVPALVAAAAASVCFSLAANLLLSGVFATLSSESALHVYRERFLVSSLQSALIGISSGVITVALWKVHPLATLFIVPFAILVRRYWKLHAAADRELDVHRQLASATQELMGTSSISAVAARVIQECGNILDCGRVELTLSLGQAEEDSIILDRQFHQGPRRTAEPIREPVPSRSGAVLGELAVWPRQGRDDFGEQERTILKTIAGQAASALENARMIAEAKAARERLDSYLSTAQDAVLLIDPEGFVKYMNPAARRSFGVLPDAPLSWRAADLFEDGRLALVSGIPSEPILVETEAHRVNGKGTFLVEAHAGPLVERGLVTGVLMVARDVSERKRLEEEMAHQRDALTQHEKLSTLGTMVAGVAHEINNPLTYMRSNLQLAKMMVEEQLARDDIAASDKQFAADMQEQMTVALEGVDRITTIASSLKNVARRGTGDMRPEDIDHVVSEVVSVVRTGIPRTVRLEMDLAPGLPPVLARSSEIHQVLLNLIKNSVEALEGRTDGVVRVRSWAHAGFVHLQVSDNGCGIPLEVQQKMFTAFFTTKEKGTGLGLNLSRGIIQAHGGEMMLASEVGVGTTFDIKLPAAQADAQAKAEVSPSPRPPP